MNIGIIGAGAIATYLLEEQHQHEYTVTSILVRNKEKYKHLTKQHDVKLFTDIELFLQSSIDIVVEAANIEAVNHFLPMVMKEKDAIIISIGSLTDKIFMSKVKQLAKENKTSIYLPSGAIGGLDLIQNASTAGTLKEVTLETRKPAHTLTSENVSEEKVIFEGVAKDAIKQFPQNINVSIALSLAGNGLEKTKVRIIADPFAKTNRHQIFVTGDFGEATMTVSNQSLPTNPKTSYLAAMSIIGTLEKILR